MPTNKIRKIDTAGIKNAAFKSAELLSRIDGKLIISCVYFRLKNIFQRKDVTKIIKNALITNNNETGLNNTDK